MDLSLRTSSTFLGNINEALVVNNVAVADSLAMGSIIRLDSANKSYYKRGALLSSIAVNSNGLPTKSVFLCAFNVNGTPGAFTTRNEAAVFIGSGNINQVSLYNRIQTYMTAVGINV